MIALAAFAGPSLLHAEEGAREAIVFKLKGTVDVKVNGGAWQPATAGMVLHEKDEIRTAKDSEAVLHLDQKGNTGKLELREDSLLRLGIMNWDNASQEKVTVLDLALGKVLVRAEKLTPNAKFEIKTPTATTGVKGTIFEVSVEK